MNVVSIRRKKTWAQRTAERPGVMQKLADELAWIRARCMAERQGYAPNCQRAYAEAVEFYFNKMDTTKRQPRMDTPEGLWITG